MNQTISPKLRAARVVAVVLASATLAALGCSLVVEFDESRIPTTDAGSDSATAETQPDTGTPPMETGLVDTGVASETGDDTGVATETSTTETSTMETSTMMETAIPDVPVVDTAIPDVVVSDADDAD